jgi:hypothetical protein
MTEREKQEIKQLQELSWMMAERNLELVEKLAETGIPVTPDEVTVIRACMSHVAGIIYVRRQERLDAIQNN